ncbi:MAG TPA: PQQ-dependent sugar dehydrogenase [Burkholderiales bacterium]|jgi:glucose/arabinose dehydrogenase|nr:PQQ-dependent sugar dehydrogenase [Burkholderiales bacterium]
MRKIVVLALAAAFAVSALSQDKPKLPAGAEGKPAAMANSTLKPHPGKMTETPAGEVPVSKLKVPAGFKVELWASGIPGGRAMARTDDGKKVYLGTRIIGRVYEVTDEGDKRTSRVVADKLTQPAGVAFKDGALWVFALDKVLRFDGIDKNLKAQPQDLTAKFDLPSAQHHQWKYVAFGPDGKLYVPFGAPCNICEPSDEYAQLRRYNADGSGKEVIARGIRNSVGFDWHPKTKELWFTDHGRDWMGDDAPNDELNRLTKTGLDFGFPYCHAEGVVDPEVKKTNPCGGVTKPVALMGPHAAVMGVKFYTGDMFPPSYKDTMFIARRGSWNRTKLSGFDVVTVKPGADGKAGKVTPFLTGFRDAKANDFWGRPVYLLQMPDGALLVSDEQNGAIYRISYQKPKAAAKKQ